MAAGTRMRVVLFCFWLALDWRFGGCVALDGRPNVVLLLADDMGLPDVGSYYDALRAGPFGDEAVGDVDKLGRGRLAVDLGFSVFFQKSVKADESRKGFATTVS